jgi:hypothetical protein
MRVVGDFSFASPLRFSHTIGTLFPFNSFVFGAFSTYDD